MKGRLIFRVSGALTILLGAWLVYWGIDNLTGFTILFTKAEQRLVLAIVLAAALVIIANGGLLIFRSFRLPLSRPTLTGNWLQCHLNLSLLLAGLLTFPLMFAAASLLARLDDNSSVAILLTLAAAINLTVLLPVGSWVLHSKRRSQHFLWLLVLPLGWLLLLVVGEKARLKMSSHTLRDNNR